MSIILWFYVRRWSNSSLMWRYWYMYLLANGLMIFLPAMLKWSTKLPKGCTCCVHRLMLKDVASDLSRLKATKAHEFFGWHHLPTQRNIKTSLVHVQSCLHVFAHESQCFLWPRMTAVQKDVSHLQEALQQLNERNEYADRSILVAVNGFVVRILSYRIVAGTLCGTHGASSAGSQFRTRWAMMAPVQFHIFLRTRFWHPKLITETKKGEQISELHKPSESMATFIIYI